MAGSARGVEAGRCERHFLPDFCGVRMVFAVVVIGELLALLLALARGATGTGFWSELSLISLFIQWTALLALAVLCLARPWLCRLGNAAAAVAGYLILLVVTAAVSEAAWRAAHLEPLMLPLGGQGHAAFVLRNLAMAALVGAVAFRYLYVQHQWKQNLEAEADARVQALQARIRPHFLFNSMNTIAALTRTDPERAEQAVEDLADLFRAALGREGGTGTLADEIALVRRYLSIERLRLGPRLEVAWSVDEALGRAEVPLLLLQPLVENAIYHGIEPLPEGGLVRIEAWREGGDVCLRVINPVPEGEAPRRREGHRLALANVAQRLALAYGERGRVEVEERSGWYQVTLRLPLREKEAKDAGADRRRRGPGARPAA
ncbi:MAG TPA: sensor histidine kinase [Chromatiales bacterium]|nr:sensor histidine kinase [Chromatiales bacterium]